MNSNTLKMSNFELELRFVPTLLLALLKYFFFIHVQHVCMSTNKNYTLLPKLLGTTDTAATIHVNNSHIPM